MKKHLQISFIIIVAIASKCIAQTVGIGSTQFVPSAMLEVQTTNNTSGTYGFKLLNSSATPMLYIQNNNNIGIGTATPAQKLHLEGGNFQMSATTANGVDGVIYVATKKFIHNYGGSFIGINAGNFTTTGTKNVAIGDSTGLNLTSGKENTFVGNKAGYSATAGNYNVFIGDSAGVKTTTGTNNVLMGYKAGAANTGSSNVFIGKDAGLANIGASANTFIGTGTGFGCTTGTGNSFLGSFTGYSISTTSRNTMLGSYAGYYNTGSDNTNVGYYAGVRGAAGDQNVSIGTYSAGYLAGPAGTYSGCVNVGYYAGATLLTGVDNINVGRQAGRFVDVGNSNICIGALSGPPTALFGSTGSNNVCIGDSSGRSLSGAAANNTFVGSAINGIGIALNISNATAIGANANVAASNTMVFGDVNVTAWSFGMAPVAGHSMDVNNGKSFLLAADGLWYNTSDRNTKENFKNINGTDVLNKLKSLTVSEWNYKTDKNKIKHIGPMAQDFYGLFGLGTDDKSISTIDPSGVSLIAIQELLKRIESLESKNKKLEIEIEKLKSTK